MKVVVFAVENLSLTGGNLYDSLLYSTIKDDPSCTVEFCEPKVHKSGFAFKKFITPFLELRWLKKLRKNDIYFWNSVDAYHCFLLVFCIKLFLPKKKVFIIHHHYKFEEMKGVKRAVFRFFELSFLRMASAVIIPSPYILDETKKHLPATKTTYLEIAFENNHQKAEQVDLKEGQMLFIGNIEHRKGLHLLLDALHKLKPENNAFFVNILGSVIESEYYQSLLQKIEAYGLENNIAFRGRVTDEEKWMYLKTSDIFVFPSLLEGYGMVIIEAMSFGLPVIAFNNSAIPYTVKDGYNGMLAADKDVVGLKEKIAAVLTNRALRDKLSQGARETFFKSRKLPLLIKEIKDFIKDFNV